MSGVQAVWRIPQSLPSVMHGRMRAWPLHRDDIGVASAGAVRVQVKPRGGRDSGPSRGFPLSERRVHPLLGAGAFRVPSGGFTRSGLGHVAVGMAYRRFHEPLFPSGIENAVSESRTNLLITPI